MKLTNACPYPALLEVGSTSDHEQLGTVVCRVSYQWNDAGELYPLPIDAMWPVARAPETLEGVQLLPDTDFRRQGIDVLVFGDAVAPAERAVTHMQVGVASGRFVRQYELWGDRKWRRATTSKSAGQAPWQPTPPEPFVRMPLGNDRAFGGKAVLGQAEAAWFMNPAGRGYVIDPDRAEGVDLPNLERGDQPIRAPTDTPVPACFHKPEGGLLLAAQGVESWAELGTHDPARQARILARQSFQQAPPDLVCPRGDLGRRLSLKGFDSRGLLHVALPPEESRPGQGPILEVEVGSRRGTFALRIATLIVRVTQRMLVIGYAASFRYRVDPGELRRAVLHWHGATEFRLEELS